MVTDLQGKLEGRLNEAGLLSYLDKEESRFVDLEDDFLIELVARDSTKLAEFGRIVEEIRSGDPKVKTLIRAHWEIESVGDPEPSYSTQSGGLRAAALYPVELRSGIGRARVSVEVSTLAGRIFESRHLEAKQMVRDLVEERLAKGGPSYWDPERYPQLEISANMAEYMVSRKPTLRQ